MIRFMNLSIMIRVAQHRNWFRKRSQRSWLPWLQSVLAMEIEVHIEPCRYGLLCDQINDLLTKDWFWTMINQLQTKKLWWALTPLKLLYTMKSKIDEYFLKVNGSMKRYGLGWNILEEAQLVEKLFTTKFKELTTIRLDLP